MADNSKKYVSSDNLKYTLQQLKAKLDQTYSTIDYVNSIDCYTVDVLSVDDNTATISETVFEDLKNLRPNKINLFGQIYLLEQYNESIEYTTGEPTPTFVYGDGRKVKLEFYQDYDPSTDSSTYLIIAKQDAYLIDFNDLINKPIDAEEVVNTGFIDGFESDYDEAYRVDGTAFDQEIEINTDYIYYVDTVFEDGTMETRDLKVIHYDEMENSTRFYERVNVDAILGYYSDDYQEVMQDNYGFITSLLPIEYFDESISVRRNRSTFSNFRVIFVSNDYTEVYPCSDSSQYPNEEDIRDFNLGYFAIELNLSYDLSEHLEFLGGPDGGFNIRIGNDVIVFPMYSENADALLSDVNRYTYNERARELLLTGDVGSFSKIYIVNFAEILKPYARYSSSFFASDTGSGAISIVMGYNNITSVRIRGYRVTKKLKAPYIDIEPFSYDEIQDIYYEVFNDDIGPI